MVYGNLTRKYSCFDEVGEFRHLERKPVRGKKMIGKNIPICRLQRLHLIPGTVALWINTEQTKIYHYISIGKVGKVEDIFGLILLLFITGKVGKVDQ